MKLYELLSRVTFDELVPTLNTLVGKTGQLPYFKMAFDELRMMTPTINDDHIDVQMAESYIYIEGCQDNWNNVLGKKIRLEKELMLTEEVLAAHILWEITFFGFSEVEMKENIGQDYGDEPKWPDNIYRRKIREIEDRTQYIIELIDKFSDIDFLKYDSITAIATTSPEYPFSEQEKTLLQEYVSSKQLFKRMQMFSGCDTTNTSHHMTLLILVSKDRSELQTININNCNLIKDC